ncbi:hypothetical protein F4560_001813 [Saccharothrix ecbatanensis]|uniref:Uncharacterized protein n=1 Tax=Saccharothrix ecbatanensis TaxID=1105145 RepID=A0A7W9LZM1_9PSEU|nr:hypothetical protein [Saccharothrix ecbatanensis]MBB5802045.1 hypothetical protein [Saccharothrix ecbatanensis]
MTALTALSACGNTPVDTAAPQSPTSQPISATRPATTAGQASTTTAQPDTSDLEAQVRAYSAAFLGGRGGEAYDLLSQRCRERHTRVDFVQMVELAGRRYGPLDVRTLTVDQAAGDMARVTYTFAKPELDQRGEPWVRESGTWRVDDC